MAPAPPKMSAMQSFRAGRKPTDQDAALTQLREQASQEGIIEEGDTIGTDDVTLKRFLRARQWNVRNAKRMLVNAQKWRRTVEGVGIDVLYARTDPTDFPERDDVFRSWPMWFHKTDKKGRPLNIHTFGAMNLPKLYESVDPKRHWETILVNCEYLPREILPGASKAAGQTIDQTFVIVDLKGFGLKQFWQVQTLARQCFQVSQDYYPETMGQLAIINAPSSFTYLWGIMKKWLSEETLAKIEVHGSKYKEHLLELIDEENLPESLGGKCTCDGLGGCSASNEGPWKEPRDSRRERREQEKANVETQLKEAHPDAADPAVAAAEAAQTEAEHAHAESAAAPGSPTVASSGSDGSAVSQADSLIERPASAGTEITIPDAGTAEKQEVKANGYLSH